LPIICFFGPDGSGKTTVVNLLIQQLNDGNIKNRKAWMRGSHTFVSVLAKFMSKFDTFKGKDNPYYQIQIPSTFQRPWQILEFVSVLPVILFKFTLPNLLKYYVVGERYTPDFLTWVSITTRDKYYLQRFEAKFLLALSSKAHSKIYVTAAIAALLQRRKENSDSLSRQLEIYEQIASILQAYTLDTTDKTAQQSIVYLLNLSYIRSIMGNPKNDKSI
jgi:ABC-type dipeptide/oligopeptide/nickel transport system ATPase component